MLFSNVGIYGNFFGTLPCPHTSLFAFEFALRIDLVVKGGYTDQLDLVLVVLI